LRPVIGTVCFIYGFRRHLADGVEIPSHQIKIIRIEDRKNQKGNSIAITKKASGDDSNLMFISSDIDKTGVPTLT
jgi:hypothetical protein